MTATATPSSANAASGSTIRRRRSTPPPSSSPTPSPPSPKARSLPPLLAFRHRPQRLRESRPRPSRPRPHPVHRDRTRSAGPRRLPRESRQPGTTGTRSRRLRNRDAWPELLQDDALENVWPRAASTLGLRPRCLICPTIGIDTASSIATLAAPGLIRREAIPPELFGERPCGRCTAAGSPSHTIRAPRRVSSPTDNTPHAARRRAGTPRG